MMLSEPKVMLKDTLQSDGLVLAESDDTSLGDAHAMSVGWADDHRAKRTFEFLTPSIRNPHTRRVYSRVAVCFMRWCAAHNLPIKSAPGCSIP
jgi:hypothetical protein